MAIENPVTIAATIAAVATVANGLLSASIAFFGVRLAQRNQDARDRIGDRRALRNAKYMRLRAAYTLLLELSSLTYEEVFLNPIAHLIPDSYKGEKGKPSRIKELLDELRVVAALDLRNSPEVEEKAKEFNKLFAEFSLFQMASRIPRGVNIEDPVLKEMITGLPNIEDFMQRTQKVTDDLRQAIGRELDKYDQPL